MVSFLGGRLAERRPPTDANAWSVCGTCIDTRPTSWEESAPTPTEGLLIRPERPRDEDERSLCRGEDISRRLPGKRDSDGLIAAQRRTVLW